MGMGVQTPLVSYIIQKKDTEGKFIVTPMSYYDTYIVPLDRRFSKYLFRGQKRTVVCPCKGHNDRDPSMGIMLSKVGGVPLYHCFGCGATGNVVQLHQMIRKDYFGEAKSLEDSVLDLLELYNLDVPDMKALRYEQSNWVPSGEMGYTEKEYAYVIRKARCKYTGDDLAKVIAVEGVKLLATRDKLYHVE